MRDARPTLRATAARGACFQHTHCMHTHIPSVMDTQERLNRPTSTQSIGGYCSRCPRARSTPIPKSLRKSRMSFHMVHFWVLLASVSTESGTTADHCENRLSGSLSTMRQLRPMSLMNTFDTIHSRDAPPTAITAICRTSIAPGAQHNFPALQALCACHAA